MTGGTRRRRKEGSERRGKDGNHGRMKPRRKDELGRRRKEGKETVMITRKGKERKSVRN